MVRMVHMNNFCGMGLDICGGKDELWTKSEILEGWEISKFSFEVQGGVLMVFQEQKCFKKYSGLFLSNSGPIFIHFDIMFNENHENR